MYMHFIRKATFAPTLRNSEIRSKYQSLVMRDFTVKVFDQCNTFPSSETISPNTFRNLRSFSKMEKRVAVYA
jgi:hypothetical protein